MSKSRQLREPIDEKSTKLPEGVNYCRKCERIRANDNFGKAVDVELDSNGILSICKDCIDSMYEKILIVENGSIQRTVLRLCKKLNIRYDERAIESAITHIQSKQSNPLKLFGLYRAKLLVILRDSVNDTSVDLSYQYGSEENQITNESKFADENYNGLEDAKKFWGKSFSPEDLADLEEKMANWSRSQNVDTQGERNLLKYICIKELEIDKVAGNIPSGLLKDYHDLLKTSGYAPSMINSANSGKSKDTFGVWLKEIGEMRPEEWVEDKSIYKDVDDIEAYGEKFLTSPMRGLVTGSREFSMENTEVSDNEPDGE